MHQNDPLPAMDSFHWLVVMGGPMNIYEDDKYSWLPMERDFIKRAVDSGKIVIGVCLGAQLIADALGSRVRAGGHKEIGWFPVCRTAAAEQSRVLKDLPPEMYVLHWHGDTFEIPDGCIHAAESAAFRSQAFSYDDRVIGLQFHLEMTQKGVENIVANCQEEVVTAPYIQSIDEILSASGRLDTANDVMNRILDRLTQLHP